MKVDNENVWNYISTFQNIEQYSHYLLNQLMTKEVVEGYIHKNLQFDKDKINNQNPAYKITQRNLKLTDAQLEENVKKIEEHYLFGAKTSQEFKDLMNQMSVDEKIELFERFIMLKDETLQDCKLPASYTG